MAGVEHDERFGAVYGELRAIAASYFRGRSPDHTLQPTALVNEVYLKLGNAESKDRAHFLALAATAMRQILIDHARKKNRMRRGGGQQRVTIGGRAGESDSPLDVLALDEVLDRLAAINEVQAKIVELRLFGGLTMAEIAEATSSSVRTVERHWRFARAWLASELGDPDGRSPHRP